MSSLAGQTFAGYEIISQLGRGGMGSVFKARQPKLDRLAALKILASDLAADPDFVARFKREAAAAANLSHPNIVQVYSAGESEETHYIAMEFVDGETLKQHIERQGRLDPREAIAITVYVAEALQYAWNRAKLIHRDIKPDNIFLSKTGEVKVGDLGLAKTVGGATKNLTQTGMMMGSPHYISPEQARGVSDIDFRTDIYSLGCTLYHMLTGRPPYDGPDPLSVITKHVNDPPPAIFKTWPTCPIPLALLVGKMLSKRPHERPASYEDLIEQLREVHAKLKPATTAAPVSTSEPTQMLTPTPAPSPAQPTPKPVVPKVATSRPATAVKPKGGSRALLYAAAGVATTAMIAGAVWWFAGRTVETKVLDLDNGVKMTLSVIPPGKFMLGSTREEQEWAASRNAKQNKPENEGVEPQKATIKQPFWIGQTEVTVGQWRQFANAKGYVTEAEKKGMPAPQDPQKAMGPTGALDWRNPKPGFTPTDSQAVTWITWNDAVAFCNWLDARERDAGRLPAGWIVRLPTEAEWEYACRAGTQTKFWWGDAEEDDKDRLNSTRKDDGFDFIAPVDSFGARGRNKFDLADMLGNTREWCLDEFDAEGAHEQMWVGNAGWHVQRGGCAFRGLSADRCAFREKARRNYRAACTGFRIVVGPEPGAEYTALVAPRGGPAVRKETAAAQQPHQTIDLLALTDPVSDRIMPRGFGKANIWERRGQSLVYVSDGKAGKVAPPVAIRARSYEIEAEFERLSGTGHFHLDLPIEDGRIVPLYLDKSGAKLIAQREGAAWPAGRPGRGRVSVRLDRGTNGAPDRLSARLDDEALPDWQGNITRFAMSPEPYPLFPGQPLTSFFCFSDNYEVRSWRLRVFDGEATVLRGAAATGDAPSQNTINLLPLIDPQKDTVAGEWTFEKGELISNKINYSRIEIPYQPPEEYDYLVEFSGNGIGGCQLLAKAGREFRWACFARNVFAFDTVNGMDIHVNATRREMFPMERDRHYVSMVEVRNNGLRAFLDGKLVTAWPTTYADMNVPERWKLRGSGLLGVGSQAQTIFHRIEVREVTGKGTFTRGAPASQSPIPTAAAPFDAAQARQHQEACAKRLGVPIEMTNSIGMKFALIPPGEFLMGSTPEECDRAIEEANKVLKNNRFYPERIAGEVPQHRVRITKPFYLGVYEVTQEEYEQLTGRNPSQFSAKGKQAAKVASMDTRRFPVEEVPFNDTSDFAARLSERAQEKSAGWRYRLPTEAEWEYACRAGTTTCYHFGDDTSQIGDYAWFHYNGDRRTHPVGQKKPNSWGLYDMHGNAMEWCQDWFSPTYYAESPADDPPGPPSGSSRIERGGLMTLYAVGCRSASRHFHQSSQTTYGWPGFRLVCEIPTTAGQKPATASSTSIAPADAGRQNAINLLPLIDPEKDAVQGTWTIQNNELVTARKNPGRSRIEIPYRPPAEYNLRVTFTRQADEKFRGFPNLILAQSSRQFMWHSDMPDTRAFGFSLIDGLLPPKNNAWVKRPGGLENGRRYTYLMQVRNGQLKAYLDDELMVQWSGEMSSLSLDPSCKLRSSDILGLLTGGCPVVFHKIELLEVTGKGTFARGAPAVASAWMPLDISAACNADVISTAERQSSDQFTFNGGRWASASWLRKNGYSEPGLPDDGRVPMPDTAPPGFFQVQMPPARNAILISGPEGRYPQPVTVDLAAGERRACSEIAILHIASWGSGTLRVTLRYETGPETTASLTILDGGRGRSGPVPAESHVAVVTRDAHPKFGGPGNVFFQRIPADPQHVLRSLTFSFDSLVPPLKVSEQDARSRFIVGIFAISALPATASTPALQHSNTPASADAGWQNAINLLPLIDPAQDATSGKWVAGPNGLVATDIKNMSQKIQPPYRPPEEYDYRVSFTPIGGNADVAIGLTAKGRSFVFYMKKFRDDHCLGFEAISGKAIASGPTAHRFPHLEMARQYTVMVEVRKNGLRGYLDGKLVAEWATDYSDMTAWPVWKFKDDTLPGFGCSMSTAVFQEVKLREVSGKGTFTRTPQTK